MGFDEGIGHYRTVLIVAVAFALAGFAALGMIDGSSLAQRIGQSSSSTFGGSTTLGSLADLTDTSSWVRSRTTTRRDAPFETARNYPPGTAPATTSPPTTGPTPDAQFDVAVPALGAHASAGQGDGSCTTVNLTAIAPDGCPEPSGEGPVVVRYTGPSGSGNAPASRLA